MQVVEVGLMAESMVFCATHESCRNQAFNLSNGDVFRWSQVIDASVCLRQQGT